MNWFHAAYEVARKEVLQHLRTKRLLVLTIIIFLTLVLLTIVLPLTVLDFTGEEAFLFGEGAALENAVLMFFLSGILLLSGYLFFQLMAILLTADGVCSEWNNRTVFLLLSKPVPRTAFVVGKYAGTTLTVSAALVLMLGLDYLILQPLIPGTPGAAGVTGFFAALGFLVLGVAAFAAVGLFFSTLTRSSAMSILFAVLAWILVFPILSRIDLIMAFGRHGFEALGMSNAEAGIGWGVYLSPGRLMETASPMLLGQDGGGLLFGGGDGGPAPWAAGVALLAHTAFFLGLSLLVVTRRDFE